MLFFGTSTSRRSREMKMNVSLPEELASFVKDKVASGRYG